MEIKCPKDEDKIYKYKELNYKNDNKSTKIILLHKIEMRLKYEKDYYKIFKSRWGREI